MAGTRFNDDFSICRTRAKGLWYYKNNSFEPSRYFHIKWVQDAVWVPTCPHMAPPNAPKSGLGCLLEQSWRPLGPSWRHLEASWKHLGASWTHLGASWPILVASWGVLGRFLTPPGGRRGRLHRDSLQDSSGFPLDVIMYILSIS